MLHLILLCLCLLQTSSGSCNRDSQCKPFKRTECTEYETIFFLLPPICKRYHKFAIPGRCINRSNLFCDVGSNLEISFLCFSKIIDHFLDVFRGGKQQDCIYRECAQCLNDSDCGIGVYCSNYYCVSGSQCSRNYNGDIVNCRALEQQILGSLGKIIE